MDRCLSYGALKRFFDLRSIEIPSDKNKLARPVLFFFPQTIPIEREPVVHSVKYSAARCSLNPEEPLRSVNSRLVRQVLQSCLQAFDSEWPIKSKRKGGDIRMVLLFQFIKEFRISIQPPVQIKRIHVEQLAQIQTRMDRLEDAGVRIKCEDRLFYPLDPFRANKINLV